MRHYIRHPSGIPIEYRIDEVASGDREHLRNISHGGLCFLSTVPLSKGASIHISIPIESPAFEAQGVVSWCRTANDCYEIGVKFDESDDEYQLRMVEQVCHIEQYKRDALQREGRALTSEQAALEWIEKNAASFPD
jgi:hypothetical protein